MIHPLNKTLAAALAVLVMNGLSMPAMAHGGEDHGESKPAVAAPTTTQMRTGTASADFELVAVVEDSKLMLYLDHFASNEPVADAKLEIESGAFKAMAKTDGCRYLRGSRRAFFQPRPISAGNYGGGGRPL